MLLALTSPKRSSELQLLDTRFSAYIRKVLNFSYLV